MAATLFGFLLSFLEGGTCRIGTAGRAAGANRNLLCGAIGLTIVVHTVLDVAADALDVVFSRVRRTLLFTITVHASILLCKNTISMDKESYFIHVCWETDMSIFVISDLHLDTDSNQKSMEVFGNRWVNYVYKLKKNWTRLVTEADTVVIPGDISWALTLNEAIPDLRWINDLPGQKILMKGNHDFWWCTASKMNKMFEEHGFDTLKLLNNNALEVEDYILAGSRGWFTDRSMQTASQTVDYQKIIHREVARLKMSLDQAKRLQENSGKEILVFLHFPPKWSDFICEEILDLLHKYEIRRCFFGHIHSCYNIAPTFIHEGTEFRMISADYLDFIPQIL